MVGRGIIWVDRKNARKTSTWERVDRTLLEIEIELSAGGAEMFKEFEVLKIVLVHVRDMGCFVKVRWISAGDARRDSRSPSRSRSRSRSRRRLPPRAGNPGCAKLCSAPLPAATLPLATTFLLKPPTKGIPRVKVVPAEPEGCRP